MGGSKGGCLDIIMKSVLPNTTNTSTGRCLVVLNENEKDYFFGSELMQELKGATSSLCEPNGGFSSDEWPRVLEETQAEIIVTGWSTPMLPTDLPLDEVSLNYVCNVTGGVRNTVPRALIERGLTVSNWGNSISRTIAESALMMALMALRRAPHWHEEMHHRGGWRNSYDGQLSLFERKVGINGFGRISRELIDLLRPFNADISVFSRWADNDELTQLGIGRAASVEELYAENSVVIELSALTDRTRGMITEEILRSIPDAGVFVNVGRGAVVDEEALIKIAKEGSLRIALDVYHKEPLPIDHPLRSATNVILLPHQAGPTIDRMRDAGKHAIANIQRYLDGKSVEPHIDVIAFDRMT